MRLVSFNTACVAQPFVEGFTLATEIPSAFAATAQSSCARSLYAHAHVRSDDRCADAFAMKPSAARSLRESKTACGLLRPFQTMTRASALLGALLFLPFASSCTRPPQVRSFASEEELFACMGSLSAPEGERIVPDVSRFPPETPAADLARVTKLVAELNQLIPERLVTDVYPNSLCQAGESWDGGVVILGNLSLETTAHEMGHSIYAQFITRDPHGAMIWEKLYEVALGFQSYELVRDQQYMPYSVLAQMRMRCSHFKGLGHPWDSEGELFASALMVYRLHPDRFLYKLWDPATSAQNKAFGKMLFVFLRDRIFHGKVFSRVDPFAGETLCELLKHEALERMRSAALAALPADYAACREPWVRSHLSYRILRTTHDFHAFVQTIIHGMSDDEPWLRRKAYDEIDMYYYEVKGNPEYCEERFRLPLSEIRRLWNDERFLTLLVRAFDFEMAAGHKENARHILRIPVKAGMKGFIPHLMKYRDDPVLGSEIQTVIEKLEKASSEAR
jgi:hypothetical protein